jgi:hypothetical protein
MIDHTAQLPAGKAAIGAYGVPVLFVHVIAGPHFGMLFTEFHSAFGIAFYIKMVTVGYADGQEHLSTYFKYKRIPAKGKALGYTRLCKAMVAYFLNIQAVKSAL